MSSSARRSLGDIAAGLRQLIVGWTGGGTSTTLFNTSSTWSVVNAVIMSTSGWVGVLGKESTPTNNIFASFGLRGWTWLGYRVGNIAPTGSNNPIAAVSYINSTSFATPNIFISTADFRTWSSGSIFASTGWTNRSSTLNTSGFVVGARYHDIYSRMTTKICWVYGQNASGNGAVSRAPAGSAVLTALTVFDRTDGVKYTAGTWGSINSIFNTAQNDVVFGASDGNLYYQNPNGLARVTVSGLPGSGAITALTWTGTRYLVQRVNSGIIYSNVCDRIENVTSWTQVPDNGELGRGIDTTGGSNNFTNSFHYNRDYSKIITTGANSSVWVSTDDGVTWTKESLTSTILGNTNVGWIRLLYNTSFNEWQVVAAARSDGNLTGSLLRQSAYSSALN
jgi:hypothetical protein